MEASWEALLAKSCSFDMARGKTGYKRGKGKHTSTSKPKHIHDLLDVSAHLVHTLVTCHLIRGVRDAVLLDVATRYV